MNFQIGREGGASCIMHDGHMHNAKDLLDEKMPAIDASRALGAKNETSLFSRMRSIAGRLMSTY